MILIGNALDRLRELPDKSVHMICTSPPYWGLRAYGTEPQIWDAVEGCEHVWGDVAISVDAHGVAGSTLTGGPGNVRAGKMRPGRDWDPTAGESPVKRDYSVSRGAFCQLCGAWRGELGSEPTPALFVSHIVQIFREARRVLKDDGVCFINMGDGYNGTGKREPNIKPNGDLSYRAGTEGTNVAELKPKDLIGMPFRLALALQDDGWWWRSWLPWVKRSAMPESAKDRPTTALETFLMFTKQEKYHWDYEAIKRPAAEANDPRMSRANNRSTAAPGQPAHNGVCGARIPASASFKRDAKEADVPGQAAKQHREDREEKAYDGETRAFRNTDLYFESLTAPFGAIMNGEGELLGLDVTPKGYKGAHFATYPPNLIRPLIMAGCPEGGIVLDMFGGTGTTGEVALQLGRDFILIELNGDYVEDQMRPRLAKVTPGFRFAESA